MIAVFTCTFRPNSSACEIASRVLTYVPACPLIESCVSGDAPSRLIDIEEAPASLNLLSASLVKRGVTAGETANETPDLDAYASSSKRSHRFKGSPPVKMIVG